MRPVRRGARPRRTRRGTVRAGNEAGADAAALECRDLREWTPGDRSAAVRVPRTASHERSPPPRLRSDRLLPFRSTQFTGDIPDSSPGCGRGVSPPIRSTGRLVDPPASPRVPGCRRSSRRTGGPSGAFREEGQAQTRGFIASRATKRGPPSEDAEAGYGALVTGRTDAAPTAGAYPRIRATRGGPVLRIATALTPPVPSSPAAISNPRTICTPPFRCMPSGLPFRSAAQDSPPSSTARTRPRAPSIR